MHSLRILCIEDDAYSRELLVSLLQKAAGNGTVIDEAADGATGLRLSRDHRPDLVFVDVGLPDISGLHVAGALSFQSPRPRVILHTSYAPEQVLNRIHPSQVSGLLVKSDTTETELSNALLAVLHDRPYYSGQVLAAMEARRSHAHHYSKILSPLELEVLPLFGSGWTDEQIASRIHFSTANVQQLRQNILHKLNLPRTAQLIHWAIVNGFAHIHHKPAKADPPLRFEPYTPETPSAANRPHPENRRSEIGVAVS
jgi:DNA-binding NarL/FixJ family response regulator